MQWRYMLRPSSVAMQAVMTWRRMGAAIRAPLQDDTFLDEALPIMFVAVLATAMAVSVGLLLCFNMYLIATCQVQTVCVCVC